MDEEKEIKKIRLKGNLILIPIKICIIVLFVGLIFLIAQFWRGPSYHSGTASFSMGSQEKEMYNATVKKYIGTSRKGSEVKSMIEDIITDNLHNVDSKLFISVHNGERIEDKTVDGNYKPGTTRKITEFDIDSKYNSEALDKCCMAANVLENNATGENNQKNVDLATEQMKAFAETIQIYETYVTEEAMEDGVIFAVYVSLAE